MPDMRSSWAGVGARHPTSVQPGEGAFLHHFLRGFVTRLGERHNGCIERFFRTLKGNLLWVRTFRTVEGLRLALPEFKRLYNEQWTMERLGYRTPAQARKDACHPHKAVA